MGIYEPIIFEEILFYGKGKCSRLDDLRIPARCVISFQCAWEILKTLLGIYPIMVHSIKS